MKNLHVPWRVLALFLMTLLISVNASALETKYYKTTATATGGGTVYVSTDYVEPTGSYEATSTTGTVKDSISFVFAKPDANKGFDHWEVVSGPIDKANSKLNANPATIVSAGTSTNENNPSEIKLNAVFVDAAVSVASSDNVLGTVSIDKAANGDGTTVTLVAEPSNNTFKASTFVGWYVGDDFKSKSPNYTLTIDANNHGVYTARFERQAGYFRVKSMYNRYAYMVGDQATEANKEVDKWAGVKFDGSIQMKPETELDEYDLSYIVKIDGISTADGGLKDLDVTSQGVSARKIISDKYPTAIVNAKQSGSNWTFYYNYAGSDRYLKDGYFYGYDYAIACGGASDHLWTLEKVESIPVHFNLESNGYYYTTLYTAFPYKCESGINVFYVVNNGGVASLTPVTSSIIPSNTGVILLNTNNVGYITPVFSDSQPIAGNLLKGVINLNGKQTEYDGTKMKVLGLDESNSINFVTSTDQYLESNSAYLDLTNLPSGAKGNGLVNTTGIGTIKSNSNAENTYDLSGRKISGQKLKKGVYIRNGKKFVVK